MATLRQLLVLLLLAASAVLTMAATRPNVILILTDDQGFGDLGRVMKPGSRTSPAHATIPCHQGSTLVRRSSQKSC